jgi:hypothetical protein
MIFGRRRIFENFLTPNYLFCPLEYPKCPCNFPECRSPRRAILFCVPKRVSRKCTGAALTQIQHGALHLSMCMQLRNGGRLALRSPKGGRKASSAASPRQKAGSLRYGSASSPLIPGPVTTLNTALCIQGFVPVRHESDFFRDLIRSKANLL